MSDSENDDEIRGGLLEVLRSRGLKAAITTSSARHDKSDSSDCDQTEADSVRIVKNVAPVESKSITTPAASKSISAAGPKKVPISIESKNVLPSVDASTEEFDESGEGVDMDAEISDIKDHASKYMALTRKYQMNLDDPEQLKETGLEDPGLVLHTAARRQRLLEIERERDELPAEELLNQEDIRARRALSTLVTSLEEIKTQLDSETCTIIGLAGTLPPALAKRLKSSGDQLDAIVQLVRQAQVSLTTARRSCELAIDGTKRRAAHFKKELLETQKGDGVLSSGSG